jgi:preprotein translocase subunit SecE
MNWDPRVWYGQSRNFIREVRTEMSKVSFPAREEVVATTAVVLVASVIFAIYLWVVDQAVVFGYQWVARKLGS